MAAEIEKLALQLDLRGFEIAASSMRELSLDLIQKELIPDSLNGESIEVFPGDSFGDIVRGYRKDRRLSQRALARKAGLDHSSISKIETGKRISSFSTVFKLSRALSLTHNQEDDLLHTARIAVLNP
ncbi:MAG: helix-turn-helix transcriptional regulator [Patescibacteria group bacterium]